jgi:hypothetical protein
LFASLFSRCKGRSLFMFISFDEGFRSWCTLFLIFCTFLVCSNFQDYVTKRLCFHVAISILFGCSNNSNMVIR